MTQPEEQRVYRPWGSYQVLVSGEGYCVKTLLIKPSSRLSLQMHQHRDEFWSVLQSRATVTVGDQVFDVEAGDNVSIPKECRHRIANPSDSTEVVILEIQRGVCMEEDIIRFDDDYGRSSVKE
jgi:mannose-6-phosphate isomerase